MIATSMPRVLYTSLMSCVFLIACGLPGANAAAAAQQYDITTRTRPEFIEAFLQIYRAAHEICNFNRKFMKLPPGPPLVTLPADFVTERHRYVASSGKFLSRREEFFVDTSEMTAEAGCKSRIVSSVTEELVHDGIVEGSQRGSDGVLEIDAPEPLTPPKLDAEQPFTERKNLGGVALRCVPDNQNPMRGMVEGTCVADAEPTIPLDGHGEAITVRGRLILAEQAKLVLLIEPVSVQIGKPVNPADLALSKGK